LVISFKNNKDNLYFIKFLLAEGALGLHEITAEYSIRAMLQYIERKERF